MADASTTARLLREARPDWVVHAAGWTWVDGCEGDPARAFRENCEQPIAVAALCHELGARFAYFSTTYVFDGRSGPYGEENHPNPVNVYARSKWAAEQRIQSEIAGTALIPRVICVWGREAQQKNFVYQVLKALREGRKMRLPSDQFGNPSWAGDIAAWLVTLMAAGERGVWNLAGSGENCSRVEWFCAIRDAARATGLVPQRDDAGFEAVPTAVLNQPAARPLHAGARIQRIMDRYPRALRGPACLGKLF